nr:hypothetical protein [Burkholderia pyrrocinia]
MPAFPHFPIRTLAIAAMLAAAAICGAPAVGQTSTAPASSAAATPDNAVLLTVFLKHDSPKCVTSHSSDEKTAPVPGMMRTLRFSAARF